MSLQNQFCFHILLAVALAFGASVFKTLPAVAGDALDPTQNKQSTWSAFGTSIGWQCDLLHKKESHLELVWEVEINAGRSQIVGNQDLIFVTSGDWIPAAAGESEGKQVATYVAAYELETHRPIWRHTTTSLLRANQQTFGGALPSPRATPLLIGDSLIVVSFTGELLCLDSSSGMLNWQHDMVSDFGVAPVQFGFSSSPCAVPNSQTEFVISAGGASSGLFCISSAQGEIQWVCPYGGFSYSTPVLADLCGKQQWVVMAQDAILGISTDGERLWQSPLQELGLTNVPSALAAGQNRVLVAGQGCGGTRCLEVTLDGQQWHVNELWHNRKIDFFYTNWAILDENTAIGCTENFLTVFSTATGDQLGRFREFRNGNLVKTEQGFLLLDGQGRLSLLSRDPSEQRLQHSQTFDVAQERTWVAPSVIGNSIILRTDGKLIHTRLNGAASSRDRRNLLEEKPSQLFVYGASVQESPDPVAEILDLFQQDGQEPALELYSRYRDEKALKASHYYTLAQSAHQASLPALAKMVVSDGLEAFPKSAELLQLQTDWQSP